MVCFLLPGQRKMFGQRLLMFLRQSLKTEYGMIFVEKYRNKLEWLDSVSLLELERKIGAIYFFDHYKMIADEFYIKRF